MMIREEKSTHKRGYAGLKKKKGGRGWCSSALTQPVPSSSFEKVEWKG
jgi:hypothetical protein